MHNLPRGSSQQSVVCLRPMAWARACPTSSTPKEDQLFLLTVTRKLPRQATLARGRGEIVTPDGEAVGPPRGLLELQRGPTAPSLLRPPPRREAGNQLSSWEPCFNHLPHYGHGRLLAFSPWMTAPTLPTFFSSCARTAPPCLLQAALTRRPGR